jgi:hypothetical protein
MLVLDAINCLTRKNMNMKLIKMIIACLVLVALEPSCTREIPAVAGASTDFSNSATVQVFSATVKAARNYVYVDGAPVSGAALAYGGVFPATAYAVRVNYGTRTFLIKDTLPTTTQVPVSFTQTISRGGNYTIFTYDTITSTKQLTVQNNIVIPTDTTCMLRFANFVYNTTPVANVDVYSFRRGTTTPVFTNVPTASLTSFIPYASGLTDTLYVYATGTTTPLIVKQVVPSLAPTRSYTSAYTGSYKGTKAISTFANY